MREEGVANVEGYASVEILQLAPEVVSLVEGLGNESLYLDAVKLDFIQL